MNKPIDFDRYAAEGNHYLKLVGEKLGHPDDKGQVARTVRAVLHTLRDRLTIVQSIHLMSQLPAFLKAIYAEGWKYHEKPIRYKSIEEFKEAVKREQAQHGEKHFNWEESTEEIVHTVINSLREYVSDGEMTQLINELPDELKPLVV